jgi:uncharacterized phiE125 gp8 family phage protein
MHLVRTAEPDAEPLSLEDAKLHCYIDIDATDPLVSALITVARNWVEQYCLNSLITQSWTVTYDYKDTAEGLWFLKRKLRLPQSPIQTITEINTYDGNNNATVFDSANYRLSGDCIVLNDNQSWPSNLRLYDSIQIEFEAGFGDDAEDVPKNIILAMKMLIAGWYEQRGSLTDDMLAKTNMQMLPVPFGVTALLSKYRTYVIL